MSELALVAGRNPDLCNVLRAVGLRTVFIAGERLPQTAVSFAADIVVVELSEDTAACDIGLALDVLHEIPRMRLLLMTGMISSPTFETVLSTLPSVPIVGANASAAVLRGALASTLMEPGQKAMRSPGWASAHCTQFLEDAARPDHATSRSARPMMGNA